MSKTILLDKGTSSGNRTTMSIQNNSTLLKQLGFSSVESDIYITLLEHGELTGYQIAKYLGIARSSVYPGLDSLYAKGVIILIPGDTSIYTAVDPEKVISRLKKNFHDSAESVLKSLRTISKNKSENRFLNIEGFENIKATAREIISQAKSELLINTDYGLEILKDELAAAIKRKVRVIIFSWGNPSLASLPVEFFSRDYDASKCREKRLIIVSDMKTSLVAGTIDNDEKASNGFLTENKLTTQMTAEHIHFDIYLKKLIDETGETIIAKKIQIKSLMEREKKD